MNTYRITGNLRVRGIGDRDGGPFHLGAPAEVSAYLDRTVLRDSAGRPMLPGTSICGVMAGLARASLRAAGCAEPTKHPAYIALFGAARGDGEGQASRLIVHDARNADSAASASLVRDRNGINRERGSADDKRLFHEEVVDGVWSFSLEIEFAETGPRTSRESRWQADGSDPDALAFRLLLDVLRLLEAGWANIGGNSGIGYGRCRLDDCRISILNRCSPDAVLAFAKSRWQAMDINGDAVFSSQGLRNALLSTRAIAINDQGCHRPPERIRFRCVLRPLEPLLVKTGYTTEVRTNTGSNKQQQEGLTLSWISELKAFAVDAGFCLDARGKSYLPGSSLRGCLRSHLERVVRTIAGTNAAWNLKEAQEKGKLYSERGNYREDQVECLVSRIYGFSALGGRILFSDLVPLEADRFESQRKLLDHVALDRFTGGAAAKQKFNSRPYFPACPPGELVDRNCDDGDLVCEIEMHDFEPWHLGTLLLQLRDLRLGRVRLGHGTNKGWGKVRLESVTMEALTARNGVLEVALPADTEAIGGFTFFAEALSFNPAGYLYHESKDVLTEIFRQAEQCSREQLANRATDNRN